MERIIIGRGREHVVFRAKHRNNIVLKKQTWLSLVSLRLAHLNAQDVLAEIRDACQMVEGSRIRIPNTRLFPFRNGRSYILAQTFIEEDQSVPNIREYIAREQIPFLVDKFDLNPSNFITCKNIVYWVDPTKGASLLARPLEKLGLLNRIKYVTLKARVKRFFSS